MTENEKDLLRKKKIKFLLKKIQKMKGESIKKRMLLFFELGKELSEDYMIGRNKNDKVLA